MMNDGLSTEDRETTVLTAAPRSDGSGVCADPASRSLGNFWHLQRRSLRMFPQYVVRLASLVMTVLVASCSSLGNQASSTGASSASSGVDGIIAVGPTCPAQQTAKQCPDRPVSTTVRLLDRAGHTVSTGESNSSGRYSLKASAGGYVLVATSTNPGRGCPNTPVTVAVGRWTDANILCDSGIR
jgi:hypothetical protein